MTVTLDYAVPGALLSARYFVEGVIGQGSFGRVYRARDTTTGRRVALKEFVREPGKADSFLRELGVLFELKHPAIIDCLSLHMSGPCRYLVVELMEAGSLRDLLNAPRVPTSTVVELLLQVAEGVVFAHGHNVVHRDLKPENVLLTTGQGGELRAKVSDFGLASLGVDSGQRTHLGSPAYMAPEQFYDHYDARVDVYALGVMLYEILCGKRPFSGSPAQLMTAHIRHEPQYPEWLPKRLLRVLKKAMAKKPEKRFATVRTFAEALAMALRAEASLLDRDGWGALHGEVLEVACTDDESILRRADAVVRLDTRGRVFQTEPPADQILAAGSFWLARRGSTATLRGPILTRTLSGLPEGASLSLNAFGAVLIVHDGTAVIVEGSSRHVVPAAHATAACFVGEDQVPCIATRAHERTRLQVAGATVDVPGAVRELFGHPRRFEVIAKGDDRGLVYLANLSDAQPTRLECGALTCDDDSFYAATPDGQLATVNVSSMRIARTSWDAPLAAVGASASRFVWATRGGQVQSAF